MTEPGSLQIREDVDRLCFPLSHHFFFFFWFLILSRFVGWDPCRQLCRLTLSGAMPAWGGTVSLMAACPPGMTCHLPRAELGDLQKTSEVFLALESGGVSEAGSRGAARVM